MSNKVKTEPMAYTLKNVVAKSLYKYILTPLKENEPFAFNSIIKNLEGNDDPIELANILKDNYSNVSIIGDFNTRDVFQNLGTEFFRKLNTDIHVAFKAMSVLKNLENPENSNLMLVDDLRFPNELGFILNFNKAKTLEEKKDVCRYVIANTKIEQNEEEIKQLYLKAFSKNDEEEDFKYIKNFELEEDCIEADIFRNILKEINNLKKEAAKLKDFDNSKVDYFDLEDFELSDREYQDILIDLGVFKINRPLLPDNFNEDVTDEGKIIDAINLYTDINKDYILNTIKKTYLDSGVEFNVKNVKEKGFQRAKFNHLSETALLEYFTHTFNNLPEKNKAYQENITEFKNIISAIIDKNSNDYTLIGINGPAGSGKGYLSNIINCIYANRPKGEKMQSKESDYIFVK